MHMTSTVWKFGLLLLTSLVATALYAEPLRLEGTLGKATVVVELTTDDADGVYGRYFYDRYRRDVRLSGPAQQGARLQLEERSPWDDDEKPKPSWTLTRAADGRWSGSWNSRGKTLPIALAPLALDATNTDAWRERLRHEDPYEFRRLHGLSLQAAERKTFMGHTLQWWREPLSGMRLFTVDGVSEAANTVLRTRLWQVVDEHLSCVGTDGEHSQKVTPELLTDRLLSLNLSTQYDCSGSAHPDFGSAPLTLDLRSGDELALEDFLWLGQGEPLRAKDGDEYSGPLAEYRQKTLAPWVVQLFTRLYPQLMTPPKREEGCNYRDLDVWQFAPWYLSAKGLYLGPTFARVARSCDEPGGTLVPYAEVRKHPGPLAELLPR